MMAPVLQAVKARLTTLFKSMSMTVSTHLSMQRTRITYNTLTLLQKVAAH